MRASTLCTAALAAVLTTGCATGMAGGAEAAAEADGPVVAIENHNWSDVNVYALVNGSKYRLGTVTTAEVQRFRLPRIAESGQVRLRVEVIGSREVHVTGPIQVGEGGRIDFSVTNHLPMSSYMVAAAY